MYRLVTVLQPRALQRVCQALWRHYGSEPRAAGALGITQPHFHRLRRGQVGRHVRASLLGALERVVAADPKLKPLASVVAAAFYGGEIVDLLVPTWTRYQKAFIKYYLGRVITTGMNAVYAELERSRYWSFVEAYEKRAAARGHEPGPGIWRALEPLAIGAVTKGLYPTLEELERAGRLKAYLHAAFEREAILVEGPSWMERARRAVLTTVAPLTPTVPRATRVSRRPRRRLVTHE